MRIRYLEKALAIYCNLDLKLPAYDVLELI